MNLWTPAGWRLETDWSAPLEVDGFRWKELTGDGRLGGRGIGGQRHLCADNPRGDFNVLLVGIAGCNYMGYTYCRGDQELSA